MRHLKRKAASAKKSAKKTQLANIIKVFDIEKMNVLLKEHGNKSNLNRNHQRFISYLGDTAGFLPLVSLPVDIFEKLEQLRIRFPNFSEVIDFYREQFALSQLSEHRVFSATPLLIAGPPGIGKTAFCHALAQLVCTHFELISLSGMTAGFVIGGMSSNWSDGKPGRVVEALARGHRANPLIVIDECDKTGGDRRYDPLGPLHQLLEKETSANFIDEGLEVATDCSYIVWVGTANELHLIAESILSRFTVIEAKRPTQQQMKKVIQSIYLKIRGNHAWGLRFSEELLPAVISKIIDSQLEPRMIQKKLIAACGKAILRNSTGESFSNASLVTYDILPIDFSTDDGDRPEIRMGFV